MDFSDILGSCNIEENNDNKPTDDVIDTSLLFSGKLLRIDETPKENEKSWFFQPLFKEGFNLEVKVWQIGYDNYLKQIKFIDDVLISENGINIQNIKIILERKTEKPNGSKKTEKTEIKKTDESKITEKTEKIIRTRYINKFKDGYYPAGNIYQSDTKNTKPVLANKFQDSHEKRIKGYTKIKKFPVSVMRKLHGIRSLAKMKNYVENNINMRSRNGNIQHHLFHIKNDLVDFMNYLPMNCELDGELYNHDMIFTNIISAVNTKKIIHPLNKKIKYYIFDIIESENLYWEDRYKLLVNAYTKYLYDKKQIDTKFVPNFVILEEYRAKSIPEIKSIHNNFVDNGYEGLVIKRYSFVETTNKNISVYRSGRNNSLLKYKNFIDEEVTITDMEILNDKTDPTGQTDSVMFEVQNDKNVRFKILYKITDEEMKKIGNDPSYYIGRDITIRYKIKNNNVPIDPVSCCFVAFRDYD